MESGGASQAAPAAPQKMPARNARFHDPVRFQSCLKKAIPHGAIAAQRCRKLPETPNDLLPTSSSAGTVRPISGPATYHGSGCGTVAVIIKNWLFAEACLRRA